MAVTSIVRSYSILAFSFFRKLTSLLSCRITSAHSQLDNQKVDPATHMAGLQSMTDDDNATDLMLGYGVARCDGYATLKAQVEWQNALGRVMQDGDFVSFGRKAFAINEKSEMGIADGLMKFE